MIASRKLSAKTYKFTKRVKCQKHESGEMTTSELAYCDMYECYPAIKYLLDIPSAYIAIGISIIALIVSIYSSCKAIKTASVNNYLNRLQGLCLLEKRCDDVMKFNIEFAKMFKDTSGAQRAREQYAEYDTKIRKIRDEIDKYHTELTSDNHPARLK